MDVHGPNEPSEWRQACAGPAFARLRTERLRLVRILLAIYLACYLGLSVLCGFARDLMGAQVLGPLNLGYALIIANYLVAWGLALIYVRAAGRRHDPLAAIAIAEHDAARPAFAA